MFEKKVVKKVVKKKVVEKKVEEKVQEYPHKFKCLDCGNEYYEAETRNNITTCSSCKSANTTRIG